MSLNHISSKTKTSFMVVLSITIGIFGASYLWGHLPYGQTSESKVVEANLEASKEEVKPQYSYFTKDLSKKPRVYAEAYIVGDLETGEIILAKNEEQKFPIASVTKLMTALVSSSTGDMETPVLISQKALATEGSNGNFRLNDRIKLSDILYPLLIESSNDAAEAIALSQGREAFMQKMNDVSKEIGLSSTSFEDPSGLSPKNISTTTDLFKLAKHLKEQKPELFAITTNKSHKDGSHSWFSNNQFLKDLGYTGGKSGYTDEALQTVISTFSIPIEGLAEPSQRPIAIVLLRSRDRHKDVANILKYMKSNIAYGEKTLDLAQIIKEPVVPEPEVKEPDFVTLAFAGDIMLDRGVKNSVMKNFGGDYSKLFDNLGILNKSDVVFANLEGTASDQGKDLRNLYSFRMDPSVVPALAGAGINIVSMANNHVGDWGRDAFVDTLARLRENEILYTGGGSNSREAEEPATMEKYGIRLGFLGFSDKGPEYLKATPTSAGILSANNPRFNEIIQNASKQVDYLIVSFHFGEEYQTTHDQRQEDLAHRAVDNGAKIVIGHHPHVMQDTEVYKNSFIAYSLGNFIFDQKFSKNTMEGMLLELKLSKDGSISATKNIVKLSSFFQPDSVVLGKEEKIKFEDNKIITQ
jgi:D-alanyl-D-alanine carboxypeptidase/poly-gamma-glutamate capsule biosynthesis protein CapA/YwtB (metallophosphatase superfamily)